MPPIVPFFPHGVMGNPALTLGRVHPYARAIARVAQAIQPIVKTALREPTTIAASWISQQRHLASAWNFKPQIPLQVRRSF